MLWKCCAFLTHASKKHCHHVKNKLPLDRINKVPNLVWLCEPMPPVMVHNSPNPDSVLYLIIYHSGKLIFLIMVNNAFEASVIKAFSHQHFYIFPFVPAVSIICRFIILKIHPSLLRTLILQYPLGELTDGRVIFF